MISEVCQLTCNKSCQRNPSHNQVVVVEKSSPTDCLNLVTVRAFVVFNMLMLVLILLGGLILPYLLPLMYLLAVVITQHLVLFVPILLPLRAWVPLFFGLVFIPSVMLLYGAVAVSTLLSELWYILELFMTYCDAPTFFGVTNYLL